VRLCPARRGVAILVVAILAACSSGTVAPVVTGQSQLAADVPDYRASVTRTGVMPGPGLVAEPVVLWRYADRSALVAPTVVAGGQVLVPENASLIGLDLSSGQRLWDVALGSTIAAPITVADGRVYATTANSVLHVIDLATRRELWRFEGAADSAQVSVQNGIAYVGTRSREFVALDPATGTRLWSVRTGKSSGKNAIAGGVAYVGGDGGSTLTAISLTTRKILWTFQTRSDRKPPQPWPTALSTSPGLRPVAWRAAAPGCSR
jgi:outer membrane protein assembly factor BamB